MAPADEVYFEDLAVGDEFRSGRISLSESEIIAFARTYDPQPFHCDRQAAEASIYGGLIASGWQVAALGFRLFIEQRPFGANSMGSPGLGSLSWPAPVRPGDTIRTHVTITATRPSKSRPELGLVEVAYEVLNQNDEQVLTMTATQFVRRRPAG